MFYIFLLAFSMSLDALGVGTTYGLKSVKITLLPLLLITLTTFICTFTASMLGFAVSFLMTREIGNALSSIILLIIAVNMLTSGFSEYTGDIDNSKTIDLKESLLIGMTLSLDSMGVCVGTSLGNFHSILIPLIASVFQFLFLAVGVFIGKKIRRIDKINKNYVSFISPIILIIIAFIKLC